VHKPHSLSMNFVEPSSCHANAHICSDTAPGCTTMTASSACRLPSPMGAARLSRLPMPDLAATHGQMSGGVFEIELRRQGGSGCKTLKRASSAKPPRVTQTQMKGSAVEQPIGFVSLSRPISVHMSLRCVLLLSPEHAMLAQLAAAAAHHLARSLSHTSISFPELPPPRRRPPHSNAYYNNS
jgi:hypothetical protein